MYHDVTDVAVLYSCLLLHKTFLDYCIVQVWVCIVWFLHSYLFTIYAGFVGFQLLLVCSFLLYVFDYKLYKLLIWCVQISSDFFSEVFLLFLFFFFMLLWCEILC